MTVTLDASAQTENLKRSFDDYMVSEITTRVPSLPIEHAGLAFDNSTQAEWAAIYLLGPARPTNMFGRTVNGATQKAHRVIWMPQVSLFVRPSLQSTGHRLQQLRDLVAPAIYQHVKIPIYNRAGDNSGIGNLVIRRLAMDRESGTPEAREDLRLWVLSVEADWVETYVAT